MSYGFNSPADIQVAIAKGTWKPNMILTNMAMAYFQADDDFVADKLFPIVPVQLSSSFYYTFSKEDLARDNMARKPEFGKVPPALIGDKQDNYSCQVEQLIIGIDQIAQTNYERAGVPGSADPRKSKVRTAVEQTKLHLDCMFAQKYFQAGAWENQWAGLGTTPGSRQFYKFDNDNADPITLFDELGLEVKRNGRRRPNKLGLGADTFKALKNNGLILERIKYQGGSANPAKVTENVLAQLFGVEKVVVLESTINKAGQGQAADMQFICDTKGALLLYAPDAPAIDVPSAGYIFAWDMLGGNQYMGVSQWLGENGTHSEFVETLVAQDMKQTGQDLAVYLTDCVG